MQYSIYNITIYENVPKGMITVDRLISGSRILYALCEFWFYFVRGFKYPINNMRSPYR